MPSLSKTTLLTLFLHLLPLASTQQQPITTTLLVFGTTSLPLDASIIAADPSSTTYSLACAPGAAACTVAGVTITAGPTPTATAYDAFIDPSGVASALSSALAQLSDTSDYGAVAGALPTQISLHCQLSGTVPTLCTESVPGTMATAAPASTAWMYQAVTITAGQEKIGAAAAATGSTASTGGAAATSTGRVATATAATTTTAAGTNAAVGLRSGGAVAAGWMALMGWFVGGM